ncbi:MAG TPA: PRC-barrel domain-containing protein [Stenomitos sp.]
MLFYGRELHQQTVVDVTTGRTIGHVTSVIWDPDSGTLVGLQIDEGAEIVRLQQITSIEPGLICVAPPAEPDLDLSPSGVGKRLETPDGVVQGLITDVIFDLATGQVLGYEIARSHGPLIVPALGPMVEEEDRILIGQQALAAATDDLSALMAMRDPQTGAILFPLSEEGEG